jgi:hypothetical protein
MLQAFWSSVSAAARGTKKNWDRESFQLLDSLATANSIDLLAQNKDICVRVGEYMIYYSEKWEYLQLERIWVPVCKALATSLTLLTGNLSSWQQQPQEQQQLPRFYKDEQVQYVLTQWGSNGAAMIMRSGADGMQSWWLRPAAVYAVLAI